MLFINNIPISVKIVGFEICHIKVKVTRSDTSKSIIGYLSEVYENPIRHNNYLCVVELAKELFPNVEHIIETRN